MSATYPRFRPVADHAVLVEFGEVVAEPTSEQVRRLDAALTQARVIGVLEAVLGYTSVLIDFDPLLTDHRAIEAAVNQLLSGNAISLPPGRSHQVSVCYDPEFAPDLPKVAAAKGLSEEQVINAHLAGDYSVFMYGFVPGYAYLGGVRPEIQVPRKPAAVRDIAGGSVIIAGPQCLVTTMVMPTGWSIIGRSPAVILSEDETRPFLFDIGDRVQFVRIDRSAFDAHKRAVNSG